MRIKITFKNPKRKTYLPINTNYYLVKLIKQLTFEYRRYLESIVPEHSPQKHFDLYTFSQLIIPERKISNFTIGILSSHFYWYVSSPYYQFLGILAKELRQRKKVKIYDTYFEVESVEFLSPPKFHDKQATFTCLSPMAVYKRGKGSNNHQYVLPGHRDFLSILKDDLKAKLKIIKNRELEKINFSLEFDPEYVRKRQNRITKVITIEADTTSQKQVRCVLAPFKIRADEDILSVIYDTGIGQMNDLGFGMVEKVENNHNPRRGKRR